MADASQLDIETADSHRFKATLFRCESGNAPTLIFLPALGTPARVYTRFGQSLTDHGINACIPDWRGIASSSLRAGRATDFGYYHLLEQDISGLIEALATTLPGSSIWLGGHSLGGQLALLACAAWSTEISGVVMIASGTVHLPCYPLKFRAGIRGVVTLAKLTNTLLGYFPGDRLGFGGREARGVMRDWAHVAHTGSYRVAGSSFDYEAALRRLSQPVLAINFSADHWSPSMAATSLLAKVPAAKITHLQWRPEDTQGIALDHFLWAKHPELIVPSVARHVHAPNDRYN